jgi:hypothetical protein
MRPRSASLPFSLLALVRPLIAPPWLNLTLFIPADNNFNAPEVASGFQQFYFELSEGQSAFYDEPTSNETPNQTRERLADIASKYVDRTEFLKAVTVGKGNGGTAGKFGDGLRPSRAPLPISDWPPLQSPPN